MLSDIFNRHCFKKKNSAAQSPMMEMSARGMHIRTNERTDRRRDHELGSLDYTQSNKPLLSKGLCWCRLQLHHVLPQRSQLVASVTGRVEPPAASPCAFSPHNVAVGIWLAAGWCVRISGVVEPPGVGGSVFTGHGLPGMSVRACLGSAQVLG
jgi:hypothetical protein